MPSVHRGSRARDLSEGLNTAFRRLLDKRAQPLDKRVNTAIGVVAAVGVGAATLWAWQASELAMTELSWWPLAVALLVTAPASLALKSAEYQLASRIASQKPSTSRSVRVAVVSSAANLLPLPGSLIVTVRSLSEDGSTYGPAISASAVPGLCWLSITGIVGGSAIAVEGPPWLGSATAVAALLTGAAAFKLFRETAPDGGSARLLLSVLGVEAAWLIISALRLGLAVTALGVDVSPTQALALSVAGALTVAIGFFPSGLGLREALIAGLSPLIGLEFDIGVLIGSVDRLVWLLFLAVASGALLLFDSGSDESSINQADR
ncbi:MAG: hypothetical protein OXN44_06990 [Acidimicrobiaceae bacterium]|nr:hypothetical protein [Acidimicrobiaceae bacterium]MDE0606776.1 hypothetical protein [Acidimicrobiaceae bacterium]